MASSDFPGAEAKLRPYLVSQPDSAPAHYLLAYALLRQDKAKEALQEYTRAASLVPPSPNQLRSVGQAYVLLNDLPDAGKWLTRAVEMDPSDPENWYSLGRLRYTEQRFMESLNCFTRALGLAPGSVKVENNLGLADEGLNRTDEAVEAYRQAIAWQSIGPAIAASEQPLLNLAIVLLHRGGAQEEAHALLLQAERIAPRDSRIQEQLGQLALQQGHYTDAQVRLEAAVRLDPLRSNLHFLLGQAHRHLGHQQQAKMEFDRAARLAQASASPAKN